VIWYQLSAYPASWPNGDLYSDGITAGFYLSVAGPGKNLNLATNVNKYYFEWDWQTDYIRFYNQSLFPGRIPEAVTLVGPEDGAIIDANGAVLSCKVSKNAVAYQLLFGENPACLNYLVSDTPSPPQQLIDAFPFDTTYWTIKARDKYGTTIFADPIRIKAGNVVSQTIENLRSGRKYGAIQNAINDALAGDEIIVGQGVYQYLGDIDFRGKAVTVRSIDPYNSAVVASTVINGGDKGPTVTFAGGEDASSVLAGLTITGRNIGIYCLGTSPTITNCTIIDNAGAGIKLWQSSTPTVANCIIAANRGAGIEMWADKSGRRIQYNYAIINNCTIVGNLKQGIFGGRPTICNSIIYFNGSESNGVQIESDSVTATYSNVQGGWLGEGNIEDDPLFADPNSSDYHLKSQVGRWAPTIQSWIQDDVTSPCIDAGDPNSPVGDEPCPNGGRINMGAYGGTSEASKSVN
jgi:parallel beta-helix repeat protein